MTDKLWLVAVILAFLLGIFIVALLNIQRRTEEEEIADRDVLARKKIKNGFMRGCPSAIEEWDDYYNIVSPTGAKVGILGYWNGWEINTSSLVASKIIMMNNKSEMVYLNIPTEMAKSFHATKLK